MQRGWVTGSLQIAKISLMKYIQLYQCLTGIWKTEWKVCIKESLRVMDMVAARGKSRLNMKHKKALNELCMRFGLSDL